MTSSSSFLRRDTDVALHEQPNREVDDVLLLSYAYSCPQAGSSSECILTTSASRPQTTMSSKKAPRISPWMTEEASRNPLCRNHPQRIAGRRYDFLRRLCRAKLTLNQTDLSAVAILFPLQLGLGHYYGAQSQYPRLVDLPEYDEQWHASKTRDAFEHGWS